MSACATFEADLLADDLLETEPAAALREHLANCARCAVLQTALREEVQACLALPADELPARAWEGLAGQIQVAQARSQLRVVLGCTFCHGELPRADAAYCATCLAPHHAECFSQHGRCSAPGCGDTQVVRSRDVALTRPRRRRWPVLLATAGWVLAGVAALTTTDTFQELLGQEPPPERQRRTIHWVKRGKDDKIAVHVSNVMLNRVIDELHNQTLLRITFDARLDGPVSLNIPYSPPREALALIAQRIGAEVQPRPEGVLHLHRPDAIDIAYVDQDVRQAILEIGERAGFDVILTPELTGTVTLDLKQVNPIRALYAIVRTVGDFKVVQETDDLLRVVHRSSIPVQLEQKLFRLEHLLSEDAKLLRPVLIENLPRAEDVKDCEVIYLPQRNAYMVRAPKPSLTVIGRFIAEADRPFPRNPAPRDNPHGDDASLNLPEGRRPPLGDK